MFKSIGAQLDGLKDVAKNQLDSVLTEKLVKALSKVNLFTAAAASAKLAKNKKFSQYESYILYMSPATMAFEHIGRRGTLCPYASAGCAAACLNTAGRGRFSSVVNARLRKSLFYILFKDAFVAQVFKQVAKLEQKAKAKNKKLVIRLNGTSDINWQQIIFNGANIFDTFKDVQFYDYTKNVQYAIKGIGYKNYHVTFSAAENNLVQVQTALKHGVNVATVFKDVPKTYQGVNVINGDDHDLRFLDKAVGQIIGLTAKGQAKKDTSGFVKNINNCGLKAA